VTDVHTDHETLTLTMTARFAAPVERVWAIYADPRHLERVWGPPSHPATFVDHDLSPGARVTYYMTAPDGQRFAGYWDVIAVDAPHGFTFDDGFAREDLTPNPDMPVSRNHYAFSAHDGGTRAVYTATYASADALQQVLDMGMVEGATTAINQIDALVAA